MDVCHVVIIGAAAGGISPPWYLALPVSASPCPHVMLGSRAPPFVLRCNCTNDEIPVAGCADQGGWLA